MISWGCAPDALDSAAMLAIIGAMDEEIELLLGDLQGRQDLSYPGATL